MGAVGEVKEQMTGVVGRVKEQKMGAVGRVKEQMMGAVGVGADDEELNHALKGHGNEADFLGVLQKLVPQRSLTLPFEPFRFWLRNRRDIRNRKTRRVGESATLRFTKSGSRRVGF